MRAEWGRASMEVGGAQSNVSLAGGWEMACSNESPHV